MSLAEDVRLVVGEMEDRISELRRMDKAGITPGAVAYLLSGFVRQYRLALDAHASTGSSEPELSLDELPKEEKT